MKKMILAASAIGAMMALPATAATMMSELGSTATFAAPTTGYSNFTVFDFNSATVPTGFTANYPNPGSAELVSGSLKDEYEQPMFSDGSQYLAIKGGGSATITSTSGGYNFVSFFIGSIDRFNRVTILGTTGAVIASFANDDFTTPFPATGAGDSVLTNRRVTYTADATTGLIGAIRFDTGANALEVDNLVFAVPEPSTWMMMLAGFGMVALSMRARRRRTRVVYA